ncbi:hypothetical protein B0H13DRAFT_1880606 [Mycena leptocephala]|nr:hypothetical protein B0H13DRAFT_1880606 [Mycena leptocephala]
MPPSWLCAHWRRCPGGLGMPMVIDFFCVLMLQSQRSWILTNLRLRHNSMAATEMQNVTGPRRFLAAQHPESGFWLKLKQTSPPPHDSLLLGGFIEGRARPEDTRVEFYGTKNHNPVRIRLDRQDATRLGAGLSNQPDMIELDGRDKSRSTDDRVPIKNLEFARANIESGPGGGDGFCGFFPGFGLAGVLDSSVLGTYTGRWIVEFGESTQPYAPVDPESGCGPEPFNMKTVEFVRTWEVVEAAF